MTRTAFFHLILTVAVPVATLTAPAAQAAPVVTPTTPAPTVVTRYSFDAGITAGSVAEVSGRGTAATVRSADAGALTVSITGTNRYLRFPAKCATGAAVCPRVILEAPDDPDLDPGTRRFQWGASIHVDATQLAGSSNVVQKGLYDSDSQWKLQIGANHGKAQCAVVGLGSTRGYVARSTSVVADGNWHKLACERNGSKLTITVDGAVQGSTDLPANLAIANNRPLRIGGPNFSNREGLYHGWLDEVYATLG